MEFLFGRHHVRNNFYHLVSLVFVVSQLCWLASLISGDVSNAIGAILFVVDYLAMMYDPHPDNMGPWFRSHFHRFFDDERE